MIDGICGTTVRFFTIAIRFFVWQRPMKTLISWIGKTDLLASRGDPKAGNGPIGQAAIVRQFDEIVLITDFEQTEAEKFATWLRQRSNTPVTVRYTKLSG